MIDNSDLRALLPPGDPNIPAGEEGTPLLTTPIGEGWYWPVTDDATGETFLATTKQVRATFVTDTSTLPRVRFVTPTTGARLPAGTNLLLEVNATDAVGITTVEFFLGGNSIGFGTAVDNDYTLPFTVPQAAESASLSATATNVDGKKSSVSCFLFIGATSTDPPAPTFADVVDDAAGGSLRLVVANGIPMSDYRYFITDTGTPAAVPSTGIISVGNVASRVFAYSVASGTRNQSPTAASPFFTTAAQLPTVTFVAPVSGATVQEGATVLLRVTAIDAGGRNISSVRLYNGATLIGPAAIQSATLWQIPYTIPAGSLLNLRAEAINEDDLVGSAGCFVFVAPAVTVPDAPTNVVATLVNNKPSVDWTVPSANGAAITSYDVFRNGSASPMTSNAAKPYVDDTAVNGTAYTYRVVAHNSVGDSPFSAPSAAVTPSAPAPVVYSKTLTGPSETDPNGVTLTTDGGADTLEYNTIASPTGTDAKRMDLTIGGTIVGAVDFLSAWLGLPCIFTRGGTVYTITFIDGAQNL